MEETELVDSALAKKVYSAMHLLLPGGEALEPWVLYSNHALVDEIARAVYERCTLDFDAVLICSDWGRPWGILLAYRLSVLRGRWYPVIDLVLNPADSGLTLKGKELLAVDDVILGGDNLKRIVQTLCEYGARLAYFVVIIDDRRRPRGDDVGQIMKKYTGRLLALTAIE